MPARCATQKNLFNPRPTCFSPGAVSFSPSRRKKRVLSAFCEIHGRISFQTKICAVSLGVILSIINAAHAGRNAGAAIPLQREDNANFVVDVDMLRRGHVQYFFALITPDGESFEPDADARAVSTAFEQMKRLDHKNTWRGMKEENLHAMIARVAYVACQPIHFFSESQTRDVSFMNRVAPQFKVHSTTPGIYESAGCVLRGIPSSRFTMKYLQGADARRFPMPFGRGKADVVVLQHNFEFGRIFGMKTSSASYAATAHYRLDPQRTLIVNCALGYIYTIPPLNAADIIREKAIEYSTQLISKLRDYPGNERAELTTY